MTKTVQIERLIELLSSIAGKFAANPTMSHLVTDGVEAVNADGLILKLDDCAKKTAMKSFETDFIAYQDETPTLEEPQTVKVWESQEGFKFFMFDSNNHHDSYLVPLKYVSIGGSRYEIAGGHIDVTTGVATITHVKETLTQGDEWHKSNTYDGSFYVTRNIKKSNTDFLSEYSECVVIDSYAYGYCAASSKNLNFWYAAEGTTTDEFKEWLSTHPIEVSYELAAPIEIELDPVTIKTLNDNTCYIQTYQGCITNVEGEYIRDISAAIEALETVGGGVTRDLIGDYELTGTQGNLTTTADMSQYDMLEIEWVSKGNGWEGGDWSCEHIMHAKYKITESKSPGDTSGVFYSDSIPTSMSYSGDIGVAVKFIDTTTIVNMGFSNTYISKIWGVKY